jgi:cytochrome c peroxidase
LWNVGQGHWFGWDGAADSLWAQSLRPIVDPREMASSAGRVASLLRGDPTLSCLYRGAFGAAPGHDDETLLVDATKALAAFQETLVSPRTAFDDFRDALLVGDRAAADRYPEAAQRGLKIFVGEGKCNACHFGPRFTNGEFGDVGIPYFVRPGEVDPGRLGGLARLAASPFNRLGRYSDDASGTSRARSRAAAPTCTTATWRRWTTSSDTTPRLVPIACTAMAFRSSAHSACRPAIRPILLPSCAR